MNKKPDLFPNRKALVFTMINPNCPLGGSSNLMRNFLMSFNKNSYTVISTPPRGQEKIEKLPVLELITDVYKHRRLVRKPFLSHWQKKDIKRIQFYINQFDPKYILLSYPHLYNCRIFLGLKLPKDCKVVGYFHDTFIEGQLRNFKESILKVYHTKLLKRIDLLFVMNEGLNELYRAKYARQTIALEHTFPEYDEYLSVAPAKLNPVKKALFWGGNILGYNTHSLSRLILLGQENGFSIQITNKQPLKQVIKLPKEINIIQKYYSLREDYILALKTNSFLMLALDWPDETKYHKDEIRTIFSTKAIEYMMAGVPIIIHAPEEYFMSKFFIEHKCGYVIPTRDKNSMQKLFLQLLDKDHSKVVENAIKTAEIFNVNSVMRKWFKGIKLMNDVRI